MSDHTRSYSPRRCIAYLHHASLVQMNSGIRKLAFTGCNSTLIAARTRAFTISMYIRLSSRLKSQFYLAFVSKENTIQRLVSQFPNTLRSTSPILFKTLKLRGVSELPFHTTKGREIFSISRLQSCKLFVT